MANKNPSDKERKKKAKEKRERAEKIGSRFGARAGRLGSVGGGNIGGIAKVCIVALIIANIFSIFMLSGQPVSFSSFLTMLSNAPEISFGLNVQEWVLNLPDWLNWLEIAINPIMRIVGLFAMFAEMAINAVAFLGYFLGWFFGLV